MYTVNLADPMNVRIVFRVQKSFHSRAISSSTGFSVLNPDDLASPFGCHAIANNTNWHCG